MQVVRALAVLSIGFTPATLAAEAGREVLPFRLRHSGEIVVPVTVAGQGPFRFLLDTGSSRTAISTRLAARFGLKPVAHTTVVTASGRTTQPLVPVVHIVMGAHRPATVLATLLPEGGIAVDDEVDGLIGQDVLAPLIYTIDYDRRQLIWHRSDPAVPGDRLPLRFRAGRALVALSRLQLIPDSGAAGFVLFARADRPVPSVTLMDTTVLRTVSGVRAARRVVMEDLRVGEVVLRRQPAVLVGGSPDADLGDGLLPLHLFGRVTFHGPGRYLVVEPRRRVRATAASKSFRRSSSCRAPG